MIKKKIHLDERDPDRPRGQPGKVVKKTITEIEESTPEEKGAISNGGFEEVEDVRDYSGYDRTLAEYMEKTGKAKDYQSTLYKYDQISKGKQFVCD